MFNPKQIRKDFPIYTTHPGLVYLDSAATALKPRPVVHAMDEYYFEYSANVARGLYPLAEQATAAIGVAREVVANFLSLEAREAVVFTANATQAINLVALGLETMIGKESNIVITELEHHSNYLPWKELAHRRGAVLRTAHFTPLGQIDQIHLASLIDVKTEMVAFSAVSNVFGVINPVAELIRTIRSINPRVLVLVDACQAAGHVKIGLGDWDADFVVFSGHKLFGPTGIGILSGKRASLERLIPMNVGGGTILDACSPVTEYKKLPENLEGGTPNIAGIIGLARAIQYVESIGIESIRAHENALTQYAMKKLAATFGKDIHILGTDTIGLRAGIITFSMNGLHPHDLAQLLGEEGIAVRAGEHCASPLHRRLGLDATTRLSLSIYSTEEDIDRLVEAMVKIRRIFNP